MQVAIVMGSKSDLTVMKEAGKALEQLGVKSSISILSAHRTPVEAMEFAQTARSKGVKAIIAGAGGAAHLPGVVAAWTDLPVIGVPISATPLNGQDALYAIVQMPRGIPVATVAIAGAWNAGLLAAQIIAAGDTSEAQEVLKKLKAYREDLRKKVLSDNASLNG